VPTPAKPASAAVVETLCPFFYAVGLDESRRFTSVSDTVDLGGLFETTSTGTITLTGIGGPTGDLAHYAGPPTTSSTVTYRYYDGHGDLAAEADSSGNRTAAYTYDPFGIALQSPPADTLAERWTGRWDKKSDTTSNLIEMGVRPYDPEIGRFLTVDPVEGGALNSYDYADQDPVNELDLDGKCVGPFAGVCIRMLARPVAVRIVALFAAGGAAAAERRLASALANAVFRRPGAFARLSVKDQNRVIGKLADSGNFEITRLGRSRTPGKGFILREVKNGKRTGRNIQFSLGSSRHPQLGPYWKISSPESGTRRFRAKLGGW
jgi:RHS repeat-associated protein